MTAGGDQPRFLHRHPSRNYTAVPYLAVRGDPECISAAEQERQTRESHARQHREQQRAWVRAHQSIRQALTEFEHSGPIDRGVLDATKAVERTAQRVDRRVGLG